MQPKSQQALR